jgi:nucleoside-diphosphate-sugar epimerase
MIFGLLRYNAAMLRVLIIGAGDVAQRILPLLTPRCQVYAVLRDVGRADWWREHGAIPVLADLDHPESCRRLDGLLRTVRWVIHLAPPADTSGRDADRDPRMRRLLAYRAPLRRPASLPQRWVYISTTGVYGDLAGAWADETTSCRPATLRGKRRVDAEQRLCQAHSGLRRQVSILRVPGIYAADRLPLARLKAGTPVLDRDDDVFSNHIHADDLARIVLAVLRRGKAGRVYHAVDDSAMRMGDYFDAVADAFAMPRPRRIGRQAAKAEISPALLSFMSESRRLANVRLKKELGVRLRYPTVQDGLRAARSTAKPD